MKYKVSWEEVHAIYVEAKSQKEAIEKAQNMDGGEDTFEEFAGDMFAMRITK